jgi:hypothetical protein
MHCGSVAAHRQVQGVSQAARSTPTTHPVLPYEARTHGASLARLGRRFEAVGPFLRVLLLSEEAFSQYENQNTELIKKLTLHELNLALRSIESEQEAGAVAPQMSHRFARYVTPKANEDDFFTKELRPASARVTQRLHTELDRLTTEELRAMVLKFESGTDDTQCNPKALETLLRRYITSNSGLRWSYGLASLTLKTTEDIAETKARSKTAHTMTCAKTSVSSESPKYETMVNGVLYHPRANSYPFVDMLWVEKDASEDMSVEEDAHQGAVKSSDEDDVGITTKEGDIEDSDKTIPPISTAQCTIALKHAKSLSVYKKLRNILEMPEEQLLIVYIATIPRCVESYLTGSVSTYFEGTSKRKKGVDTFKLPGNVEFRVLLPDPELKNCAPAESEYEEVLQKVRRNAKA